MKIEKLNNYIKAKILVAYLIEEKSHRAIQREILELPAPSKGGGFLAMDILHHFNVKGKDKGLLRNNIEKLKDIDPRASELIKKYLKYQTEAIEKIETNRIFPSNRNTEKYSLVKTRIYQDVLKKFVSKNYNNECALCEINQPELLVASHIIPWHANIEKRLHLDNCILFCSLHDKMFDKGLLSFDSNLKILVSKKLSKNILKYVENLSFKKPISSLPNIENLKVHYEEIFRK